VGGVGIATARYRADMQAGAVIRPQAPVQVYLGQLRPDETTQTYTFDTAQQTWKPVERPEGRYYELAFDISNGATNTSYCGDTQEVRIRILGSLGLWNMDTEVPVTLKLRIPRPAEEPEATEPTGETTEPATESTIESTEPTAPTQPPEPLYDEYTAEVTRITVGTSLYHTYGEGWLFRFLDQEGRELTWDLAGGQFSSIHVELILEGADPATATLLQLQITGDKK
jgi:hypothetical protein